MTLPKGFGSGSFKSEDFCHCNNPRHGLYSNRRGNHECSNCGGDIKDKRFEFPFTVRQSIGLIFGFFLILSFVGVIKTLPYIDMGDGLAKITLIITFGICGNIIALLYVFSPEISKKMKFKHE